jgi:hypothetical protein
MGTPNPANRGGKKKIDTGRCLCARVPPCHHRTVFEEGHALAPPGCHFLDSLEDLQGSFLKTFRGLSRPHVFVIVPSPTPKRVILEDDKGVVAPSSNFLDSRGEEAIESRSLPMLAISEPQLAVLVPPPAVKVPSPEDNDGMKPPAGDVHHRARERD